MPESGDVDGVFLSLVAVDDAIGAKEKFPGLLVREFADKMPAFGKGSEGHGFVEKSFTKADGGFMIITGDVLNDVPEVIDGRGGDYYSAIHVCMRLRRSWIGMPWPFWISSKPSFTPAMNSISRAISWSEVSSGSRLTRSRTISRLLMGDYARGSGGCKVGDGFRNGVQAIGLVRVPMCWMVMWTWSMGWRVKASVMTCLLATSDASH